jgi:hypothetical protein
MSIKLVSQPLLAYFLRCYVQIINNKILTANAENIKNKYCTWYQIIRFQLKRIKIISQIYKIENLFTKDSSFTVSKATNCKK